MSAAPEIFRGVITESIWRGLQMLVSGGALIFVMFFAASHLGPEVFGRLAYTLAVVSFVALFANFGISAAASKHVAETGDARTTLWTAGLIVAALGTLAIIISLILAWLWPGEFALLAIASPILLFKPLGALADGVLRGVRRFKILSLIALVCAPLLIISAFLFSPLGGAGILLAFVVYYTASAIGCIWAVGVEKRWSHKARSALMYALWIGIGSLGYFFFSRIDIIVLRGAGYVSVIGEFELINQALQLLVFPLVVVGHVIAPRISKMLTDGNIDDVRRISWQALVVSFVVGVAASVALLSLFPIVVNAFFPAYATSSFMSILTILCFLLPLQFWSIFSVHAFMTPGGFASIYTTTAIIGGVFNTILDVVAVILFGAMGIFYVTLLVHSVVIVVTAMIYFRRLHRA